MAPRLRQDLEHQGFRAQRHISQRLAESRQSEETAKTRGTLVRADNNTRERNTCSINWRKAENAKIKRGRTGNKNKNNGKG